MSRMVEAITPIRLGRSFRWLLASSWISNIGDGIGLAAGPLPSPRVGEARAGTQIVEGLRWLWSHRPIRTLTITIVAFNVTFGAAWSVLVLYASERLDLGAVGFGVLSTMLALGAITGSAAYARIERRFSLADVMRVGLLIETFTHLTLAVTTSSAVALVVFFVFGIHAGVWGTTATSIRQRAVPTEFQGRVGSVYMIGVHGGLVAGAALGGVLARLGSITTPFWFGFVGSAIILTLIWRELTNIAHLEPADAPRDADLSR